MRRIPWKSRPVATLLVILVLWLGWSTCTYFTGEAKLTPAVQSALQSGRPVDIVVTIAFAPEEYHMQFFQRFGRLTDVTGTRITLRDVEPSDVHYIAHQYWVQAIGVLR